MPAATELAAPLALRRCTKCGVERPLSEFHRRGNGHQQWCKPCRKTHDAAYHAGRKPLRLEQKRVRKKELLAWMRELKTGPCTDCGGRFHPAAMQFDHLPGIKKTGEIAVLVGRGCIGLARAELEKCELVCANCHAIRTYKRREAAKASRSGNGGPSVAEGAAIYRIAA